MHKLAQSRQEAGGGPPVDETMVEGQADDGEPAGHDPSLVDGGPLSDATDAENRSLRWVDDGREGIDTDGTQVRDGEGASPHLLARQLPAQGLTAEAGALAGIDTLQGYTDWMKNLLTPVPDGRYEVRSFAVDVERQNVAAYGVFRGTHTGEGGPVPPTGRSIEADYVYVMQFDEDKIRHVTKIWNDGISLQQLGWM